MFGSTHPVAMPRGVKKENLPTKVCVVCQRPFNWRKKWEKVWDEVTTCSKSCNRKRRSLQQQQNRVGREEVASDDESRLDAFRGSEEDDNVSIVSAQSKLGVSEQQPTRETDLIEMYNADDVAAQIHLASQGYSSSSSSNKGETSESESEEAPLDPKAARKAAKKQAKALRRAQREGRADPSVGQKPCDVCGKSVDLLIRCTIDQTGDWKMVCGKCWHTVSGGVVDGSDDHPYYRYGGLWKNRAKR